MPGPSFPLIASVGTQPGPHVSSSMQLQQKHQIRLDENQKVSVTSSNYMKPLTSPGGQPSLVSTSDAPSIQKARSSISFWLLTLYCFLCSILLSVKILCVIAKSFGSLLIVQPQSAASVSSVLSSSTGFTRPSRAVTSASNFLLPHNMHESFHCIVHTCLVARGFLSAELLFLTVYLRQFC